VTREFGSIVVRHPTHLAFISRRIYKCCSRR
jgi:hypothetical protein